MNLNDEQQQAYNELIQFIETPTENKMFCLKGYAGTGKTFLISRVIEHINAKRPGWGIALTAPTNKAVQVLRESSNLGNKVKFKTIHSLLGLKEVIKDSGEIEFEKDWDEDGGSFRTLKIVIIDEVSMLADKLFYEIKRYNNECKIILMGDPAQIPPVGKDDCEPFLNPEQHGIYEFQLTKIMRQGDGSSIVENSMAIRNDLARDGFTFMNGNDLRIFGSKEFDQKIALKQFFKEKYQATNIDHIKVIAWTNRKVVEYNHYIRKLLYGENADRFVKGERLIMNKPFEAHINDEDRELLTTNMEVTVKSFEVKTVKHSSLEFYAYRAVIEYVNLFGTKKTGRIIILHENSEKAFQSKLNELKQRAITGPTSERRDRWKVFYGLLRSVADVQYAYAITAHKSQGSTYKTAIVDSGNIQLNKNIVERNRILYTSITRAKDELVIIN